MPTFQISAGGASEDGSPIYVVVSLDGESEQEIWVDFEIGDLELVANRMATPTEDYYLWGAPSGVFSGTINFAPGETIAQFEIGLVNDTPYEGREWLSIQLSNPVNAQLGDDYDNYTADVWIDDVDDPFIVVSNIEVVEPQSAEETAYAKFRVEMVGGNGGDTSEVTWTTSVGAGDTATSGGDFQASSGTAIAGDSYNNEILVPLVYDGVGESEETFRVSLTGATNGITILVAEAVATILDAITVPEQEPPPDCQCGAEVGRKVTSVTSDHGFPFWEGDSVKFTAGLSDDTPRAGEVFEWRRRPLLEITQAGTREYGDWEMLPGSGNFPDANTLFPDPFTGEVRVQLTSLGTISSRSIEVRAKAAYPVNLQLAVPMPHLDHRRLKVTYTWESSSGRPGDLDGVKMGEFVWVTDAGFYGGQTGKNVPQFVFPDPPFDRKQNDGEFIEIPNAVLCTMDDFHGGGHLTRGSNKQQATHQFYWSEVTDAATYTAFVDGSWQRISDDPRGKQIISGSINTIYYSVSKVAPTVWKYNISKWNSSGASQGSVNQFIDEAEFPWDAATN